MKTGTFEGILLAPMHLDENDTLCLEEKVLRNLLWVCICHFVYQCRCHLEIRVDAADWCSWAAANGVAPQVIFFIQ